MAPRTKTLKNCVIAYTDNIPPAKRDKIKSWVEHAGGSISKEITDDVTHLILTGRDWKEYHPKVKEARSRKTIYLMRMAWLEFSLLNNKSRSKPLDEREKSFTWEVKHAKKVVKHRSIKKAEKKKQAFVAKIHAARQEQELAEEDEDGDSRMNEVSSRHHDPIGGDDLLNGSESLLKSIKDDHDGKGALGLKRGQNSIRTKENVNKKITNGEKLQQISECGIKFDKSILETERDMALAGYRPYVDPNGVVYLIMLVRNDINQTLQEQYKLKRSVSPTSFYQEHLPPLRLNKVLTKDAVTRRRRRGRKQRKGRFDAGKDTRLRYLGDPICCNKSGAHCHSNKSIDKLNDGQYTPVATNDTQFGNRRMVKEWVNNLTERNPSWTGFRGPSQYIPFSSLPVIPYTPMSTLYLEIRVPLPQPFAYTLQLYESIDQSKSPSESERSIAKPITTFEPLSPNTASKFLSSFTQYLPQDPPPEVPSAKLTPARSPVPTESISTLTSDASVYSTPKETYMLICQYTRKGTSKVSETAILAPEGSTFVFAMDMFRKIFRKKTGLTWDEVKDRYKNRGMAFSDGSDNKRENGDFFKPPETGSTLFKDFPRQDSDNMSVSSGTIQGDEPVHTTAMASSDSTEPIQAIDTTTTSPPLNDVDIESSEHKDPTTSITPWTLSSSKDVERAGYRPFTYVPTEREIFEKGNEKYRAQYGGDLFLYPEDGNATVVKSEDDEAD